MSSGASAFVALENSEAVAFWNKGEAQHPEHPEI